MFLLPLNVHKNDKKNESRWPQVRFPRGVAAGWLHGSPSRQGQASGAEKGAALTNNKSVCKVQAYFCQICTHGGYTYVARVQFGLVQWGESASSRSHQADASFSMDYAMVGNSVTVVHLDPVAREEPCAASTM